MGLWNKPINTTFGTRPNHAKVHYPVPITFVTRPSIYCQGCGRATEYWHEYDEICLCAECNTQYLGYRFCMKELRRYDDKADLFKIILETDPG